MTFAGSGGRPEMVTGKRLFHTLDLLRGIAALVVVALHLDHDLARYLPSSHLAVDLFFVLSGFVLAHAYDGRLREGMGFKHFARIRVVRLYPLYILGTAIGAAIALASLLAGGNVSPSTFAASLALGTLFLPATRDLSVNHFHVYPFNFPAWSLFWELLVNLLFAAVAPRLGNRLLSALMAVGLSLLAYGAWAYDGLVGGSNVNTFALGGLRVLFSFFAGIAAYRIWSSGRFSFQLPAWASALCLVAAMVTPGGPLFQFAVVALGFPVLVICSTRDPAGRLLPICTTMGVVSYPIYALHAPFVKVEQAMRDGAGGFGHFSLVAELAFLAGMVALALMASRFYDAPVRRWLSAGTGSRVRTSPSG